MLETAFVTTQSEVLSLVHKSATRHDTTRQHATRQDRGPRYDRF